MFTLPWARLEPPTARPRTWKHLRAWMKRQPYELTVVGIAYPQAGDVWEIDPITRVRVLEVRSHSVWVIQVR